jgi:tetraacyldisaccharide 4'-kinase
MLRILLFPFSILYDAATSVRNHLYDRGLKPSVQFEIPVIGVGNLAVGGTGKTPMVEYLVRLLTPAFKIATLSRGYARSTKGFRIGSGDDNAQTLGDEPFQFLKKFQNRITVAVGEERALAIPLILQEREEVQVIILDDAFQHRRVRASFNILLSDYNRLFYDDLLLPAGRLRESKDGANRADIIVITKCPADLEEDSWMRIEKKIRKVAPKPVFFTTISYSNPLPLKHTQAICSENVILLTGIANADPLADYVKRHYNVIDHVAYPDHHRYSYQDLERLEKQVKASNEVSVLTTEKDMVKIDSPEFESILKRIPVFYIPITVQFLKHEAEFNEMILTHVKNAVDKNNRDSNV